MITTNLEYEVDLAKGFEQTKVKSILATYDDLATVFTIKVMRNGLAENLSGASCTASFVRSDGTTIPLVGSVSGNVASVTLSESCYRYAGKFEITIRLSLGGVKSTIFIGSGSIYLSETDAIIDEEDVIPSIAEVIAQQQQTVAATNAANAAAQTANAAAQAANAATEANTASANAAVSAANAAAGNANEKAQDASNAADRANDAAQAAEDIVAGAFPFFDGEPSAPGEANAGTSFQVSRGDHVHPLPALLPIENGGTGVTSAEGIKQSLKAFSIVGDATDANTAVKIGLYGTTSSTANLPSGTSHGLLFNVSSTYEFNNQTGIIDQFFFPIGGGRIWRRSSYNDETWSFWTLAALDAYPVGAIYMSYVATSPAFLFGGEWTQIRDRFLVGAGRSYDVGAEGGAVAVTLTEAHLPASQVTPYRSTDRFVTMCGTGDTPDGYVTPATRGTLPLYWDGNWGTRALGGGAPHENRPPYYAVYIWRRTA